MMIRAHQIRLARTGSGLNQIAAIVAASNAH